MVERMDKWLGKMGGIPRDCGGRSNMARGETFANWELFRPEPHIKQKIK
jgi:hypothetical protein